MSCEETDARNGERRSKRLYIVDDENRENAAGS